MQDVPDRRRLVLAAVFQEDGVKFGVVDNGGHFESANFVNADVKLREQRLHALLVEFGIAEDRAALLAPLSRAAKPPECAAPARRTAEFRSRKFLATCWKNADNKVRYAGVCKGRVFLASEKFNPVRECGPGFRKNLQG